MSAHRRTCARVIAAVLALWLLAPAGSVFAQNSDAVVDMQGISFVPKEIHVGPGATVLWANSSPLGHTVTADDGAFDSGMLDPGAEFSMFFDTPGTYQYYCQPHGGPGGTGMAAVVVVDDPNAVTQEIDAPAPMERPRNPDEYQPDH
jgi:plastocyanin